MSIFSSNKLFLIYAVLFTMLSVLACEDDGPRIVPPCEGNPTSRNTMTVNGTARVIADSFSISDNEADGGLVNITGFTNDCNQMDELRFNIIFNSPGLLSDTFNIRPNLNGGPGTATGSLDTQILDSLSQSKTALESGTIIIRETSSIGLRLELDAVSFDGDIILVELFDL